MKLFRELWQLFALGLCVYTIFTVLQAGCSSAPAPTCRNGQCQRQQVKQIEVPTIQKPRFD